MGTATLACTVRTNIRFKNEISPQKLVGIFLGHEHDLTPYRLYLYSFFEECYPSLIYKFMAEQGITKQQIMRVFNWLPERGEKQYFREVLARGEF